MNDPARIEHFWRQGRLYCCLCFEPLTPAECHLRPDGRREDVCNSCAWREEEIMLNHYNAERENKMNASETKAKIVKLSDDFEKFCDTFTGETPDFLRESRRVSEEMEKLTREYVAQLNAERETK